MIMHRRILYLGIAAGVLSAVAVGLWLLFAKGEPVAQLSAAQALQQACDTMAESDYDKTQVERGEAQTLDATVAVSGGDSHVELNIYDADGESLLDKIEWIIKDEVVYARGSISPDDLNTLGEWGIYKTAIAPDLAVPCFGADVSAAGGSAAIEGSSSSSERRIVWKTEPDGGITIQHVLWVDSTGRPVRGQVIKVPPGAGAADASGAFGAASTGDDSSSEGRVVLEESYSGFGEPNIITAPIATPTP